jgi:hypothetical protein
MRQILTPFLLACLFLIACKNTADTTATPEVPAETTATIPTPELTTTVPTTAANVPVTGQQVNPTTQVVTPPAPKAEPAQNAKGVWHFTCPKGCKGGAGAVGPCAKCGTQLTHNAVYHEGATPPAQSTAGNLTVPTTATTTPPQPQKVEPPQNAKGVWHYTCAKGCAGGAGSAAPCAKCGATLAHNATYHQ